MAKEISFVIPVLNEAANIATLSNKLQTMLATLSLKHEIIFVDDGSTDNSLEEIKKLSKTDSRIFYIELSRNFGHQYALKAGMDMAKGDCVISMDADLQHPPHIFANLISTILKIQ